MITTVEPVATYTERTNRVLALYRGCRGDVTLYVPPRQDGWIWSMPASNPIMPPPALDAIDDGRSLRLTARTTSGDLPALVAIWRGIRGELTCEEVGPGAVRLYHKAAGEDVARVRAGLARFALAPTFLVDGGDEVWCAWALSTPLAGDHGRDLLVKLAEHVGGDVEAGEPGLSLPLAGKVKNWSSLNWTGVQIIDASKTYTVAQIADALSPPIDTETPALRTRVRP
jgi:hypothetical protein